MIEDVRAIFERELDGTDLAGSASNKFAALRASLAVRWGLDAERICIKAIADPKNYGNRISEATRQAIERLVLVARSKPDVDTVARAFEARSLIDVPTLVVHFEQQELKWDIDAVLVAPDVHDPFKVSIEKRVVRRASQRVAAGPEVKRIITFVQQLSGRSNAELRSLEQLAHSVPRGALVVTHASEARNLYNRIGEAIGQRPAICVIVVTARFCSDARESMSRMLHHARSTRGFLVVDVAGTLEIEELVIEEDVMMDDASTDGAIGSTGAVSGYRELERVKLLKQYLPFDAAAPALYEEKLRSEERFQYDTRALAFVRALLSGGGRKMIVLTGNAGHGKTHICRRIVSDETSALEAARRLDSDPKGVNLWNVTGCSLPVRIVKDLSHLTPEAGATLLEMLIADCDAHAIICANEGRLRDVVARRPHFLQPLLDALEGGLDRGATTPEGRDDIHVVNLNHQATTPNERGFLDSALSYFLNHQGAWKVCDSCAAKEACPILANRNDLAISAAVDRRSQTRRDALISIVRVAEQQGYVLTYREALILVAFLVTGSLTCNDVARLHRSRSSRELEKHRILVTLFESNLAGERQRVLKVIERIRRLDPGRVALRSVDERIHEELEERIDLRVGAIGEATEPPRRSNELKQEFTRYRENVRQARRRAWFEAADDATGIPRSRRIGLHHHHQFEALHDVGHAKSEKQADSKTLSILRGVVRGLHAIQGVIGMDTVSSFHLVDPAFMRSSNPSAVIARTLRVKSLWLYTESAWWRRQGGATPPAMVEAVEWLDRRLLLVDEDRKSVVVALDLLGFEFVMNAGQGVVMRDFHSAERRRILSNLAKHAEVGDGGSDKDIRVLLPRGGEGRLTVERDGTISLEVSA